MEKKRAIRYSIYIDLNDNECIWDSVYAYDVQDAIRTFRLIYQQLQPMTYEKIEEHLYVNEDNQKAEWKDYLPSWQRGIKQ